MRCRIVKSIIGKNTEIKSNEIIIVISREFIIITFLLIIITLITVNYFLIEFQLNTHEINRVFICSVFFLIFSFVSLFSFSIYVFFLISLLALFLTFSFLRIHFRNCLIGEDFFPHPGFAYDLMIYDLHFFKDKGTRVPKMEL